MVEDELHQMWMHEDHRKMELTQTSDNVEFNSEDTFKNLLKMDDIRMPIRSNHHHNFASQIFEK